MNRFRLYENKPADLFDDAHLLGNGALGASVFGGVPYEKILINHDTLWSGQERRKIHGGTKAHLEEARRLALDGKLKEANNLINDEMLGYWSESYMPLGYLHITVGHTDDRRSMAQRRVLLNETPYENYARTLDLERAVARVEYDREGVRYTREMFVSKPDNVLAVRLAAAGGELAFSMCMDSPLRHEQRILADGAAVVGRAPDRVEPYEPHFNPTTVYLDDGRSDALRFASAARVAATDGDVSADEFRVYVRRASYAVILLAAGTNYAGYKAKRNRDAAPVLAACMKTIDAAAGKGYEGLLAAHVADYRELYARFSLDLGEPVTDTMPTTDRLRLLKNIDDPSVLALITQYSRYLLISFSRPGTEAGNLQGIWNPSTQPPWASNYTTNINVQMNYWGAESLALPECHLPMSDLVRELSDSGREAARDLYGARGWVAHHNTDLWRFAGLAGEDASWAWWPVGGIWMCQHLWQHYEYTLDDAYLRDTVYPVLRGAAEFLLDFVVKDRDGRYVTALSTSPENKFFLPGNSVKLVLDKVAASNRFSANREDVSAVCKASTMDLALVRELLGNYRRAAGILGRDDDLGDRVEDVLANLYLPPLQRLSGLGHQCRRHAGAFRGGAQVASQEDAARQRQEPLAGRLEYLPERPLPGRNALRPGKRLHAGQPRREPADPPPLADRRDHGLGRRYIGDAAAEPRGIPAASAGDRALLGGGQRQGAARARRLHRGHAVGQGRPRGGRRFLAERRALRRAVRRPLRAIRYSCRRQRHH
jgi:alpha-L-fucosidase 2